MQLGVTTTAANNHVVISISSDNQIVTKKVRDNDGDPKAAAKRSAEKLAKVERPIAVPSSPAVVSTVPNTAEKSLPRVTRSRDTTVYGKYKGKAAAYVSPTPPTTEWLQREGAKLASAAASPQTCFLQSQSCTSSSSAVEAAESTVLQTVASDEKSFALTRPTRAKYSAPSCNVKRHLDSSIFELLRSKTPRLV